MPRTSIKEQKEKEHLSIREHVEETAKTIADDERALLAKLQKRYKDEDVGERVPGKVVKGIKTIWTYNDMCARFPIVDFIPDETLPIIWNGVKVQAISGIEMHVPKPFCDIYKQRMARLRQKINIPGVVVELGAGALPPET